MNREYQKFLASKAVRAPMRGQIDLEKNYDLMLEYREQQERRALMASSRKLLHRLEEVYGTKNQMEKTHG